jgi:hypothetical protein
MPASVAIASRPPLTGPGRADRSGDAGRLNSPTRRPNLGGDAGRDSQGRGSGRMHATFARKLRLTAAALGCSTRKALCAKFRAANPATICDIDRLHKWMQGRAMPREPQFFEDWRSVIASPRSAAWLLTSTVEAFAADLALAVGIELDELWRREGTRHRDDGSPALLGTQRTLHGAFACYSHAWSPRYRGSLIRGSLRIGPASRQGLHATYTEALMSGTARLSGDAMLGGGMMHVVLKEGASGAPLFLSVITPGWPASVLCGVLAGPALIAHAALPSATRIVAVRTPEGSALEAGNGYLDRDGPAIAADLARAGLHLPDAGATTAALLAFLGADADQVGTAEQLALCDMLDRAHAAALPVQALGRAPARTA